MTSSNDQNNRGGSTGEVRRVNPDNAATDPSAAAQQNQVKADHDALQEQARRVESSVPPDVRDTPVQRANPGTDATEDTGRPVRNADAARDNADAARESARRVQDSVAGERDRDQR
jgi:hypothetical protein